MARGGFVADNIEVSFVSPPSALSREAAHLLPVCLSVACCCNQALRAMGLTGDDGQLLTLLKAADYNLERAVNL